MTKSEISDQINQSVPSAQIDQSEICEISDHRKIHDQSEISDQCVPSDQRDQSEICNQKDQLEISDQTKTRVK